jgi:CheY-like chemotaxis protein
MTTKIIVADDSQTIQKVIKITFGSRKYELIPCLSEAELFENLSNDTSLVLLDFSLSETKSGYELGTEVKAKNAGVPIMALLGTFDTVDEDSFRASGYSDKVVKPFETEKFINKCEDLIANGGVEYVNEDSAEEEEISGWDINSPQIEEVEEVEVETEDYSPVEETSSNELSQELGGWGFSGPDLQGSDVTNNYEEYPPVIEAQADASDDELEDGGDFASKFLSAENLISEAELDHDLDQAFENTFDGDLPAEEENQGHMGMKAAAPLSSMSIEELEAGTEADAFWSVDEELSQPVEEYTEEVVEQVEEVEIDEPAVVEAVAETLQHVEQKSPAMMEDLPVDLEAKIRGDIEPIVEKYVQEYCKERVEKVVWEIIPDLAENLIRRELKEISKKVLQSMDN